MATRRRRNPEDERRAQCPANPYGNHVPGIVDWEYLATEGEIHCHYGTSRCFWCARTIEAFNTWRHNKEPWNWLTTIHIITEEPW